MTVTPIDRHDKENPQGLDPVTPRWRHTRRQRLIRTLFYFFGPAQNGPPPYATPEELEKYQYRARPEPTENDASPTPHGFTVREYTDTSGVTRRYVVETNED